MRKPGNRLGVHECSFRRTPGDVELSAASPQDILGEDPGLWESRNCSELGKLFQQLLTTVAGRKIRRQEG